MSGGYFDYLRLDEPIYKLSKELLFSKGKYSEETIKEFKKGLEYFNLANIYLGRIDYLFSGDDGEESFHKRLNEELKEKSKSIAPLLRRCRYCELNKNDCPYEISNPLKWRYAEPNPELKKKYEENATECWDFEPSDDVLESNNIKRY